jgi:Terminase RNaseH-like domain
MLRRKEMMQIKEFAHKVLRKTPYPYQLEVLEALVAALNCGQGGIYTVMMARQSGKNELSAILEAYLLATRTAGTIIKAAPTYKPQVINSRMRLMTMLESPFLKARVWTAHGYIIGLAPDFDPNSLVLQTGPRVMLYSAGEESNVVGGTASLLLEVDEAQDVDPDKYNKEFAPMVATTNALVVMYGTAWSDETLPAQMRAVNLDHEARTGERRHFEYDWHACAKENPKYKSFVQAEIARLGEQHVAIQTQYFLRPISGLGYLFNTTQRALLTGTHPWQEEPTSVEHTTVRDNRGILRTIEPYREITETYIAGIDIGGEERLAMNQGSSFTATPTGKRDATVITIGRVHFNELDLPCVEIVHQAWWEGVHHLDQYAAICALAEQWNLRHITIDATGLGASLASMLASKLGGEERVTKYVFSRPSKSRLAFQFLAFANSGRMKHYRKEDAPEAIYRESWFQLSKARYQLLEQDIINIYVDAADGHDDFLSSLMLLGESLTKVHPPAYSCAVRPADPYKDLGRYA